MAVSSRTFQTQLGREATAGAAVDATARWTGPVEMQDDREVVIVEEDIGQYVDRGTSYIAKLGATINFADHPLNLEEILHPLEAGLGTVSPSGSGPYTYAYTLPGGTSDNTIKTYTIENGDATNAEEAEYCFVETITIKGGPNEPVMLSSTWKGRQVSDSAFTAALSLPTVEPILFNTGVLYIDDGGGTIGSTQVSNSFLSFSLEIKTGLLALQTAEGQLYFTLSKRDRPAATLTITAEHDSTWDPTGEKAAWRAKTTRLVRIRFTGTSSRQLTIDLAGLWTTFGALQDQDGNSVIEGTMQAINSATDSLFFEIEVINNLAAVP